MTARISIKSVVLGGLVNVGGTFIGLLVCAIAVSQLYSVALADISALEKRHPEIVVVGYLITFGFALLGAFAAARLAGHAQRLHGGIVGGLTLLFRLAYWQAGQSLLETLVDFVLPIPVGVLGGVLATSCAGAGAVPGVPAPPATPAKGGLFANPRHRMALAITAAVLCALGVVLTAGSASAWISLAATTLFLAQQFNGWARHR